MQNSFTLSRLTGPKASKGLECEPGLSGSRLSVVRTGSHSFFPYLQVDTQLACMMSENSVDYIARFNDLAQELSVTEPSLPPPGV